MKKFEEEFNYLIELSGKVLTGQIEAEEFETHRAIFLNEYGKKQQLEIPEVPQFVAEWYEENKERLEIALWDYICDFEHQEKDEFHEFMKRITTKPLEIIFSMKNGYTVAKEKRFYLKNKLTGLYLYESKKGFFEQEKLALELTSRCDYTQQEINSMETGSYEQIEVQE
ncbi:DUF1642 domain-containing protein [Lactococcus garvieae]|uniref:DUF1642 domain-containing protein n=1 Tax=Lactococcus garvieae TaxID=1363 RepID=UPI001CE39A28|nr:DUF1642 domain-containing protein [Lactococcus garvieae]